MTKPVVRKLRVNALGAVRSTPNPMVSTTTLLTTPTIQPATPVWSRKPPTTITPTSRATGTSNASQVSRQMPNS